MNTKHPLAYTGEALHDKTASFQDAEGIQRHIDVYRPAKDLQKAVQLAHQVGRPLLLMGEAGCGKTRLAEAVAYELHKEKMYDHFFTWHIKSTTKAQEGIYQFDYIKRMYDANTKDGLGEDAQYVQYGALAKAFMKTPNGNLPNILLIDEIDKADLDFPNDLLLELDKKRFVVPELAGKTIEAHPNLLIFITSNNEKPLPDAFLRRCLFHYIEFPKTEELQKIVLAHCKGIEQPFLEKALEAFLQIRADIDDKKPSTSELLDWFQMIAHYQTRQNAPDLTDLERELVGELQAYEAGGKIPYYQLLFKTHQSLMTYGSFA